MPIARRLFLLLPLLAASCGSEPPPAPRTDFAPLDFSYLTTLPLNVATLDIDNQAHALSADDVSDAAPTPPAQALTQMAQTRLRTSGSSGRAVFTIQQADITRTPGGLSGQMHVRLDIITGNGNPVAFAEARASRLISAPQTDLRGAAYDLTRQMMGDMNVEFEYQVRHALRDWLIAGATPVQSQPLASPAPAPVSAP